VRGLHAWLTDPRQKFDPKLSFQIYQATLGAFADKIAAKKRLSIVTNGPLTSLPPQLLITKDPSGKSTNEERSGPGMLGPTCNFVRSSVDEWSRTARPGLRGLELANVISKILLQLARERSQVPKCSGDLRRICPIFSTTFPK
jgi:hypothetical protein